MRETTLLSKIDSNPYNQHYGSMKTTIDLPEEILQRAKIVAIQRKTTLKALIVQGLDHAIRHEPMAPDESRIGKNQRLLDALQQIQLDGPVGRLNRDEIYDRQAGKWEA